MISSKSKLSLFEKKLLSIINKSILLSNPKNIMKNQIKKLSDRKFKIKGKVVDLSNGNLYVLGWGKTVGAMAEAIESILGADMIKEGIVISTSTKYNLKKIKLLMGSHPFPSEDNIYASEQIIKLAKKCNENDYVICLISGGGSALLCLPSKEISLNEKIETTKIMIKAGVEVEKINVVRKHISRIKGGGLAKFIYPASTINLIISDDVRNVINSIASGPTIADPSTFADALQVINKHQLGEKIPEKVVRYLKSNVGNDEKETPKENSIVFSKTMTFVIYDNKAFLKNLREVAIKTGFKIVEIYPATFYGNVNAVINKFCAFINDVDSKAAGSDILILAGGEVEIKTVPKGKGGRAQHFAALMIPRLQKFKNFSFAAVATDGKDFIDGIAGALINDRTMGQIIKKMIDYQNYIEETNTFDLHHTLGTHLFTLKPTQINVFDVYIFGRSKANNGRAIS